MNTSEHGLQFIEGWEGIRLFPYDDGGPGVGNCTVGIGHLIHLGPCGGWLSEQRFKRGISIEQAYALLRIDVIRYEDVVKRFVKVHLNQNQFDALVDFCYNTGGGYPEVWATVNSKGDLWKVLPRTAITPSWATPALVRRRRAECELFYSSIQPPVQEKDHLNRINAVDPFFENRIVEVGLLEVRLDAWVPQLPTEAHSIDLQVFTESGGIEIRDGDNKYAGEVVGFNENTIRVIPIMTPVVGRIVRLNATVRTKIRRIGIVAWYS